MLIKLSGERGVPLITGGLGYICFGPVYMVYLVYEVYLFLGLFISLSLSPSLPLALSRSCSLSRYLSLYLYLSPVAACLLQACLPAGASGLTRSLPIRRIHCTVVLLD